MWLSEISWNSYLHCLFDEDDPKVRSRITGQFSSYRYCLNVKDRPEIRKNIKDQSYLNILDRNKEEKCG